MAGEKLISQQVERWDVWDTVATALSVLIILNIPLVTLFYLGSYLGKGIAGTPGFIIAAVIVYGLRYANPLMSIANIGLGAFFLSEDRGGMGRLAIITGVIGLLASLAVWVELPLH